MAISVCDVRTNGTKKDVTPYGSAAFPVACYEDDMRQMTVPVHWHDEYEYVLAVRGTVTVCLGTDRQTLNEGDAVFVNAGCLHAVKSVTEGESVLRSLVILPRFIGGAEEGAIAQRVTAPLAAKDAPAYVRLDGSGALGRSIAQNMMTAWEAVTEETYDYENEARYRIARGLRMLADHLTETGAVPKADGAVTERMKRMLAFIGAHYAEDIGNRDLTELCGVSESVLLRNFRTVAGTSPAQYILGFRIRKAAELLLTTEQKAAEIARACGFRDVSYFTKTFREKTGMTPAAYRKAKRP